MISLCMITKNEESYLRNALVSVQGLVDEIIIIDTGSTDKTKLIAAEFTDKIFDFRWNDSFATARNASIERAKGNWILCIDADECISAQDHSKIKAITSKSAYEGYFLIQRNYTTDTKKEGFTPSDDYSEAKQYPGYFPKNIVRLFRNNKNFQFKYRIHEAIELSIIEHGGKLGNSGIPIHHYNFLSPKSSDKKKFYQRLQKLQIKDSPSDPKPYYELGQIYRSDNKFPEAITYFEQAFTLDPQFSYVCFELGYCYAQLKTIKNISKAIAYYEQSRKYFPSHPSTLVNLANIYMRSGKTNEAIELLTQCIEKVPNYFLAYKNLILILKKMGKVSKAKQVAQFAYQKNRSQLFLSLYD